MKTRRTKAVRRGICKVCGCTDEHGCVMGCSWTDRERTLCSECAKWCYRASKAGADRPSKVPLYALWIVDGGPRGRGHWLVETDDGENTHPAMYFDRASAEKAAQTERDEGLDVVVIEVRASAGGRS